MLLSGHPGSYLGLAPEQGSKASCLPAELTNALKWARDALGIPTRKSRSTTANFFLDDATLAEEGVSVFKRYAVRVESELALNLFVEA